MNGLAYLFDSDVVVDYLRGDVRALDLVRDLLLDGISVSVVTYGEVYEGILYGRHRQTMGASLLRFLEAVTLLDVNQQVAERYAEIRGDLRAKGLLLDNSDLLIAATALHHDLTLVTRNQRHFGRVPGIKLYPQ